jgi:hypothetical protein
LLWRTPFPLRRGGSADFFQNREFSWAIVQLWEFLAETATAAGRLDVADEARASARQALMTSS